MSAVHAPERRQTPAQRRTVVEAPAPLLTVSPVFVDNTGRHRRRGRRVAWVVAALCTIYLALFGAGLTGRPVDPSFPLGVLVGGPSPTTSAAPVTPPPTTATAGTHRTTARPTAPAAKAVVPRTPTPTRRSTFWPPVQPTATTSVSVSAPSTAATTTTSRTQQETTSDQPDTEDPDTQEPGTEETSTAQTSTEETSTEQTSTEQTDTDESDAIAPSGSA
jgi:hypothetical protein